MSENIFLRLGRLKTAIKQISGPETEQRALDLLDLISKEVSRMDLDLPKNKRINF